MLSELFISLTPKKLKKATNTSNLYARNRFWSLLQTSWDHSALSLWGCVPSLMLCSHNLGLWEFQQIKWDSKEWAQGGNHQWVMEISVLLCCFPEKENSEFWSIFKICVLHSSSRPDQKTFHRSNKYLYFLSKRDQLLATPTWWVT